MNMKKEKTFWWTATLASYTAALYVVYLILTDSTTSSSSLIHTIGMSLICYFTTSCLISVYEIEAEANSNNESFRKDPHRGPK